MSSALRLHAPSSQPERPRTNRRRAAADCRMTSTRARLLAGRIAGRARGALCGPARRGRLLLDSLRAHAGALRRVEATSWCATWPIAFARIRARARHYDMVHRAGRATSAATNRAAATSAARGRGSREFRVRRARVFAQPNPTACEFAPAIGPAAPDRYVISLRWRDARDETAPTASRYRCWRSRRWRAECARAPRAWIQSAGAHDRARARLVCWPLSWRAAALSRRLRGQRKPGAPAGCRAACAVSARARHRTRGVLRVNHGRRTAGRPFLPGAHACGTDFAVALRARARSDNTFRLGADASDCAPTASAGGARAGNRHTDAAPCVAESARRTPDGCRSIRRRLSSGAIAAVRRRPRARPVDDDHAVRDLEVRSYYIANDSVDRPGWPALRVKALTESRGAAQFRDEEVMPGVEDLQVEMGVAPCRRRHPARRLRRAGFAARRERNRGRGAPVAAHPRRRHRTRLHDDRTLTFRT